MSSFYFLLDAILDMSIFLVLIVFLTTTLKPIGGKWYHHLPLISVYVIQSVLYLLLYKAGNTAAPPSVIDFFSWVGRMVIVALLYKGNKHKNMAIYALFSFSNTLSRLFVYQLLGFLDRPHHIEAAINTQYIKIYVAAVIAFVAVAALLLLICKKYLLRYLDRPAVARVTALLCSAINVSYFILIPIITSYKDTVSPETTSVLFITLMVAITAVIITAFIATRENSQRRAALDRNAMLQSQLELQYQHFLEMEKADTELHKLRHDIANHMLILKDMMADGTGAPAEYVQRLTERYDSATTAMICRNFIFNAVLNRQRELCEQNGVEFHFQIDVPPSLEISDIDLMGVLSNMLSNAVNASLSVPEGKRRYVYISARLSADVLAVAIENSAPLPGEARERSEEDGHSHGWGIKIIKEAVEKYDGVFKLQIIRDKAFTSATMMNRKM